jgi:hypothetical protein
MGSLSGTTVSKLAHSGSVPLIGAITCALGTAKAKRSKSSGKTERFTLAHARTGTRGRRNLANQAALHWATIAYRSARSGSVPFVAIRTVSTVITCASGTAMAKRSKSTGKMGRVTLAHARTLTRGRCQSWGRPQESSLETTAYKLVHSALVKSAMVAALSAITYASDTAMAKQFRFSEVMVPCIPGRGQITTHGE